MRRVDGAGLVVLTLALGTACGGGAAAKAETPEAPGGEAKEPAPASDAPPRGEGASAARDDAKAESEAEGPPAKAAPDQEAPKGRDIVYRPTADGLVIEVEGVKLEPLAVPLKTKTGWGVTLSLKVTSTDGHMHKLLKSESGPFMVAAEIDRGGKKERFGDERKGEAEEFVPPGDSVELKQKVEHSIYGNQTLFLQVGLWGLGRDDGERRPVKKLFVVKMVPGSKKPAAVISPPE